MSKRIMACIIIFSVIFSYSNVFSLGYEFSDERVTFIVEMDSEGVLEMEQTGEYDGERAELADFVKNSQNDAVMMAEKLLDEKIEYSYTHVINGFAIEGNYNMMERLMEIDGVKNVYVSEERFEFMSGENQAVEYTYQNQDIAVGLDKVRDEYTGKGTVIGIIDSELDITHPAFNSAPQNPRLSKSDISDILNSNELNAEIRNKNTSADNVFINEKLPFVFDYVGKDFNTSYSKNYHGTHVTGVAAGKSDEFSGAASDAQIVFMKCAGDSANAGIADANAIAALDDMVKIGVDVVNMSFGYDSGFAIDVYQTAVTNASNSGIAIISAAGNRGRMTYDASVADDSPLAEYPDYGLIAAPSTDDNAVSVAAATISSGYRKFELDGENIFYSDSSLRYMKKDFYECFAGRNVEFEYIGLANGDEEYAGVNLNGKIALADRGVISFEEKVAYAAGKGAAGVIVVNTDEEFLKMEITSQTIPAVVIRKSDGDKLKQSLIKEITVSDNKEYATGTSDTSMASFSSWGVTPDLKLKPDITAVGQNVYSTAYGGKYEYMSGTSMSSPQYAGCVAVALEYLTKVNNQLNKWQKRDFAQVLLCSTAKINTKNNIPISPRKQGAGIVNVDAAVKSPVVLYKNGKTKINLGDKLADSFEFTFTAQNLTSEAVTYDIDGVVLTDDYITDSNGNNLVSDTRMFNSDEAKITFNTSRITVGANASVNITVRVDMDKNVVNDIFKIFKNGFYVDGFIRLTSEKYPEISIPFMGFKGDWLSAPIFYGTQMNPKNNVTVTTNKKMYSDETGLFGYMNNQYFMLNKDQDKKIYYYSPAVLPQLNIVIGSMRNIKTALINVYDSNNVNKNNWRISNIRKTQYDFYRYSAYTLPVSTYKDGEYRMKVTSAVDYGDTSKNTQEMEFGLFVDSQSPVAEGAYIKDGKLYVRASDNSTKTGAFIKTSAGTVLNGQKEDGSEGLYSFNLFGLDLNKIRLYVSDYAQNSTEINISSGFEGVFDGNTLIGASSVRIFSSGGKIINLPTTEKTNVTVKYFAWDNMKPLFPAGQYTINN